MTEVHSSVPDVFPGRAGTQQESQVKFDLTKTIVMCAFTIKEGTLQISYLGHQLYFTQGHDSVVENMLCRQILPLFILGESQLAAIFLLLSFFLLLRAWRAVISERRWR